MKLVTSFAAILLCAGLAYAKQQPPRDWVAEWPETEFQKAAIAFSEIRSGGPPKDGIPAIHEPVFETLENGTASGWVSELSPNEAVIAFEVEGDARAYPLRILI